SRSRSGKADHDNGDLAVSHVSSGATSLTLHLTKTHDEALFSTSMPNTLHCSTISCMLWIGFGIRSGLTMFINNAKCSAPRPGRRALNAHEQRLTLNASPTWQSDPI